MGGEVGGSPNGRIGGWIHWLGRIGRQRKD